MSQPSLKSVQCASPAGLHRVAYKEWGDPANPRVLVCVHGITRVSDDFDALALALSQRYRVVCPDIVGRGRSSHLSDPAFYTVEQYVADMVTLLARVTLEGTPQVDWFGTSMGGLIGMLLASYQDSPVRRLVLNDIGPVLDGAAMQRIGQYLGQELSFPSFEAGLAYVKLVSASFGPHDQQQWRKLAADVLRQGDDGRWYRHYDLRLAQPFLAISAERAKSDQARLWAAYDAIVCPTLLVRGEHSDLLSRETAQQMRMRGPHAQLVEIAGVGHAPTFVQADQIAIASEFLTG